MKSIRWPLGLVLFTAMIGCQGNDMTKDEMDRAAHAKFDDAARAKMAEGMRMGADARLKQEADWVAAHPAEAAKVNAIRAKNGRPPLGQK